MGDSRVGPDALPLPVEPAFQPRAASNYNGRKIYPLFVSPLPGEPPFFISDGVPRRLPDFKLVLAPLDNKFSLLSPFQNGRRNGDADQTHYPNLHCDIENEPPTASPTLNPKEKENSELSPQSILNPSGSPGFPTVYDSAHSENIEPMRQQTNEQPSASQRRKRGRSNKIDIPFNCEWCNTPSTPEKRRGPSGSNTLCNACGLKYAKQKKESGGQYFTHLTPTSRIIAESPNTGSSNEIQTQSATPQQNSKRTRRSQKKPRTNTPTNDSQGTPTLTSENPVANGTTNSTNEIQAAQPPPQNSRTTRQPRKKVRTNTATNSRGGQPANHLQNGKTNTPTLTSENSIATGMTSSTNAIQQTEPSAQKKSVMRPLRARINAGTGSIGGQHTTHLQNGSQYSQQFTNPPTSAVSEKARSTNEKQTESSTQKNSTGASKKRGRPPVERPDKCLHCGARQTPEWRKGPLGKNTLCNACGLQYAKNVKRKCKYLKINDILNPTIINPGEK